MQHKDFQKVLEELQRTEIQISATKGVEYAQGEDDALRNFKEAARFLGLTAKQACLVYMYKHFSAIANFAYEGRVRSESLRERVCDLRLYAALMLALELEEEDGSANEPGKSGGGSVVSISGRQDVHKGGTDPN